MEIIKEWMIIISAIIVVLGWFINSWLNNRHEISKKRLDYRLDTLNSFLPVYLSITSLSQPFKDDEKLNNKIKNAWVNFQLYGYKDEIKLFDNFVYALKKADTKEATITINGLMKLTRNRIRNELNLPLDK